MDTLSVIVYSHNSEATLAACLQSILGQSYRPTEVVVVDDTSDDESDIVVEAFASRNVAYQALTCSNRRLAYVSGIEATFSSIVCCIDAKDTADPRYLERGMRQFRDPRIGVVYSDTSTGPGQLPSSLRPRSSEDTPLDANRYIHPASLVRRHALTHGKILVPQIQVGQENWCDWPKLLSLGYVAIKQEALFYSPTSATTNARPSSPTVTLPSTANIIPAAIELPSGTCSGEFITEDRFDEAFYLSINADVRAALASGALKTGYEHYTLYGRQEKRRARAKS